MAEKLEPLGLITSTEAESATTTECASAGCLNFSDDGGSAMQWDNVFFCVPESKDTPNEAKTYQIF